MASQENNGCGQGDRPQEQRVPSRENPAAPGQGDNAGHKNSGLANHAFMQAAMNGGNDTQQQQIMLQQAIQASLQSFITSSFAANSMGIPGMNPPLSIGVPQQDQLLNSQQLHQSQSSHPKPLRKTHHYNGSTQLNSRQFARQIHQPHPPSQISFSGYPMFENAHPILSTSSSVTSNDASRKRKSAEFFPSKDWSVDDSTPRTMDKEEFDRLSPSAKRRYERNLREQQRSHQISQQIKQLRDVLSEAKVCFKPNKFSILVSVSEYIQQLQSQAIVLDADYQRLVETIRQTQEVLGAGGNSSGDTVAPSSSSAAAISSEEGECRSSNISYGQKDFHFSYNCTSSAPIWNGDGSFAQSIDYEQIFLHCPYPWALASLDGRVLSCNPKFAESVGATHHAELVQQSLFLFIQNHQEIFEAMADLLKRSTFGADSEEAAMQDPQLLFWCGSIVSTQDQRVSFGNISVVSLWKLPVHFLWFLTFFFSLL